MATKRLPASRCRRSNTSLTIATVCAELGVARSTYYDWRAARSRARTRIKLPHSKLRVLRERQRYE